jgi:hypothetical protein
MSEIKVAKSWIDAKKYQSDRLREIRYEAEFAERFLNDGLLRSAAAKAYQASKAFIAGISID